MNAITEKLHLLESVAPNDAVLASMLDKVLGAVADQDRQKLSGYRSKLQELERLHEMGTDAFLQRFEAGDLGDAPCSGSIATPSRLSGQKPNANSASWNARVSDPVRERRGSRAVV